MKRIVFVIGNYKNGGVAMRSTNLANEFAGKGYAVTILATKDIAHNIFFKLEKNVELVSLCRFIEDNKSNSALLAEVGKQENKIRTIKRLRYLARFAPKWDKKLEREIRGIRKSSLLRQYMVLNQETVVIPFGAAYYEQVYYAVRGLNCKVIYAERNAPELEVSPDPETAAEFFRILGKADGAVFQTLDEKAYYEPYIRKNTAVIHNPIKKGLPLPFTGERRKVIVNYCRISQQKNLYLLIEAFADLHKEFPGYSLEIYGNTVEEIEEKLRDELVQYVMDQRLEDSVHILPPSADVHDRVKDCAMFVSSSDFEGLSNSMIEAMAIGLPCVCTDCLGGGAREMIEDGINGILVPVKDRDALCQGMKRVIADPLLAEKLGRNAAEIVKEMSVEIIAEKWLEVIRNA
ncbi:MAG: glycosyltransferase [Clostridia bacterium]|nr:glycosyltransferase [Clostridia bacterium]